MHLIGFTIEIPSFCQFAYIISELFGVLLKEVGIETNLWCLLSSNKLQGTEYFLCFFSKRLYIVICGIL